MADAVQPVFFGPCKSLSVSLQRRIEAEPAQLRSHTELAPNSTGGPRVQLGSVFLIPLKHSQSAVDIGLKRDAMAISEQLVLHDV
jgi:hypothetical protein